MKKKIEFMGLIFDSVSIDETIDKCLNWCRQRDRTRTIITINVSHLMMMRNDPELATASRAGNLIVADGLPVVWATRMLGKALVGRVAGVDLFERLLAKGNDEKLRIFLLGARQEVLDKLNSDFQRNYPNLVVAGSRNGYFKPSETPDIVKQIADSKADILFIGMPSPFKEVWGQANREELGASIIVGVGGSFDVIAGFVKRAPGWMQKSGLEWLWRLMMEPRKLWKRYLICNAGFIYRLTIEIVKKRFNLLNGRNEY